MPWVNRLFPWIFDYKQNDSWVNNARRKRARHFFNLLHEYPIRPEPYRILDVGGTYAYWKIVGLADPNRFHITLFNLSQAKLPDACCGFDTVAGNAMFIDVPDLYYDISFSNSVIEHMGSYDRQKKMAQEMLRVGKKIFIQTPSKWFPLEPHSRVPFFQFLPRKFRAWLIFNYKINYFPRAKNYEDCLRVADSTILLSLTNFKELFLGGQIIVEYWAGIPKSYTIIKDSE